MESISSPSTSKPTETAGREESDDSYKHPFVDFQCALCGLKETCFHGKLTSGNGHYPSEVYFMRDPFEPPSKKSRKLMLFDFLVLGSICHLCSRPICIHKSCSVFFGNHFCVDCISRERRRFPDEVLQSATKGQESQFHFTAPAQKESTETAPPK